jgi:hypothetical protein
MPDHDDPPRDESGHPVHPETGLPVGDVEPEYTPTLAVAPNGAEMPYGGTEAAPEAEVDLQGIADQVQQAIESGRTDAELEKIRESTRGLREALMRSDRIDPEKLQQRMTI